MDDCLQHCEENTDFEKERDNIKNVLWEKAEEKIGKIKLIRIGDT